MSRSFTEKENIKIRQDLLDAGLKFLYRYGFQKTTVEDLAHAANISKGEFYHFFPSKETLYFCIFDNYEHDLKINFLNLISKIDTVDIRNDFKDKIKTAMYSDEVQNYFGIIRREELANLLKKIEPDVLNSHLEDDMNFFKEIYTKLSSYGIIIKAEPEKIQAYINGLFALFFERKLIDEKYFDMIINSYIEMFIDIII
jgi:AcrR family transcriptional regulator